MWIPVRVTRIAAVKPLIKRFTFEPLEEAALPAFSGGAHIVVEMQDGNVIRRNAYSLMSSPRDTAAYSISVLRENQGRGGSRLLHDMLQLGTVLRVSAPANLFPIRMIGRKHLMIAGGIGITPFIPMGEQLMHERKSFELHYAVRSLQQGAYIDELRQSFGRHLSVYASDAGERLPLEHLLARQPLGTHVYVCGPSQLIDAVLTRGRDLGWPDSALHAERFTAPASGKPYTVDLARSDMTVHVGPDQSMLDAIEAAGITASYLCRGGACGQCQTRVLSCDGTLLHADHFLSEAEKASGTTVMPCVSRFEGRRLVLEL